VIKTLKLPIISKNSKIATIAYNMKECLRFLYFHIWSITKFGYNIITDYCHLGNIRKLKLNFFNLKKKHCYQYEYSEHFKK